MDVEIIVTGTEGLVKRLEDIANIDINRALLKTAIAIENDAKKNCPVDEGELRASITHEVKNNEATVGTNKLYAPYVEIGTGIYSSMGNGRQTPWRYQDAKGDWHYTEGQRPQPYLMPALQANKSTLEKYIKEELEKK